MCVFRKPGYYILAFSCLAYLLLFPRIRRIVVRTLGAAVLISWFLMEPLPAILGISPGDPREMLSLPMQQTAAVWIRYSRGEIPLPEEDAEAIRELISEPELSSYNPWISDPVKRGFRTDVLTSDPGGYLRLYLRLGARFPRVYFSAARDMLSGYWIMGEGGHFLYLLYTDSWPELLKDICFTYRKNFLPSYLRFLSRQVDRIGESPALLGLLGPTLPVWLLFACLSFGIARRRRPLVGAVSLLGGQWIIQLLSPAALVRYGYPMMLCLPVMLMLVFETETGSGENVYDDRQAGITDRLFETEAGSGADV